MNTKDLIKQSLQMSAFVINGYMEDISEEELFMRPAENANHVAWQIGHLISAEHSFMKEVMPEKVSALPANFTEKHAKEMCSENSSDKFCSKAEYMELLAKTRSETLACLEAIDESRFDEDAPESIRAFCPTVGDTFMLCASHYLMHSGQIAVLRRKLDKPIVI